MTLHVVGESEVAVMLREAAEDAAGGEIAGAAVVLVNRSGEVVVNYEIGDADVADVYMGLHACAAAILAESGGPDE